MIEGRGHQGVSVSHLEPFEPSHHAHLLTWNPDRWH
jgi:hypothetical protein